MQKFIEEIYPLVLNVCRDITVNYEDLAHDVILKLYDNPDIKHIKICELRFYVYVIARNKHLNNLKRERYVQLVFEPKQLDKEIEVDPYQYIQRIKASNLDEMERLWIELYLDEGNYSEIERRTGISRQTASQRLNDIFKKLRT